MKTKKIISMLLALAMICSFVPSAVFAEATQAATVYLTISNQGVIASDRNGNAMVNREVLAEDLDEDGKITYHEALIAAHKAYSSEAAYVATDSGYGISVNKLWGIDTFNTLMFKNNSGILSGIAEEEIVEGDKLVASINKDNTYYADWFTFFDSDVLTVETGEEFTLTLKGHLGMAYTAEEMEDTALSDVSVGTWNDGEFSVIDGKVTDADGKVTLSFDEAGIYYVSASGSVKDMVTDWSSGGTTLEADCPIIAPACVVTVEENQEEQEPSMSDAEAIAIVYAEFSGANENKYNAPAKTPLIFPLEYNGETYTNVISYLKAWALKETGRELEVGFDYVNGAGSYTDWSEGYANKITLNAFEEDGSIVDGYFKDNEPTSQRLSNVYFKIGDETAERIASIYVKAESKQRTQEEIVNQIAENIPFERIQGKNASAEEIVQAVGESTATTVGALPTSDSLYSKSVATITWTLENVSGKSDALKLASNKITVYRPNVGEADAVFNLSAKIASVSNSEINRTISYELTVPAFDAVTVPIQVTEGATLTLTDNYYKTPVDEKYIVKQEYAPEGFDLYYCDLHTSATGTNQTFAYKVEKENYITQSSSITVSADAPAEAYVCDLAMSSDNDTKLGELAITAPTVSGFEFDPDVTDYTVELAGATQIKFSGSTMVGGASAKITSYYSSLANANKGALNTSGKALTTTCYLPDAAGESQIKITVTAPEGSIQESKTRVYTITVKKTAPSGPMTALVLTASSSAGGKKNNVDISGVMAEETLTPSFVNGGKEEVYYYTVNYFRDKVTIKPTAKDCTITVNGNTVTSGSASEPIDLAVGDNEIIVSVTKDSSVTEYKIIVHRKEKLIITDVTLEEGTLGTVLSDDGSDWTGSCNFANGAETIHVTYHTNVTENVKINVEYNGNTYSGVSGEPIELPVGDSASIMPKTNIFHTVDDVVEGQSYVISFRRVASGSPSAVSSYLPAPGQFVNLDSYLNPGKTLSASGMVTLGAFGGNIVYKYDEPIENNPNNPYGIDFIVMGNCFVDNDGGTAAGAAEPASVMVSEDGENWYELAGSEYYLASARRGLGITYTNGDTDFVAAADTPWTNSDGESGVLPKNEFHDQPYYPNPANYSAFQSGIGKNDTYSAESVSFTGTMIDTGFYPFGYADSHTEVAAMGNKAANPYVADHEFVYNGDGFDLDWAVDESGNRVELGEISYIKIYNPVMSYGGSTGEKSAEIKTVLRAMPKDNAVGKSEGLSELSINGEEVSLTDGEYTYDADGKGASSLVITPTAVNPDANIYVSNQRVVSGESTSALAAVSKLRIIVQEGEKEPVIYIISFSNVASAESNADITSVKITPGDEEKSPDEDGNLSFSVANSVSAIRITPVAANNRADITLSSGKLSESISLVSGTPSDSLKLSAGENVFTMTVKSVDSTVTKVYNISVTRQNGTTLGGDTPEDDTIKVKFSLTGDMVHYDYDKNEYITKHTAPVWIKSTSVEIPKGSTVKYLTEMMLNNAGIDYTSDGIYVSEIKGLAEFDNGPNSGWMYRYNGYIAEEGYESRELSDGDVIKWFYSDDYTKESNYEGNWDKVNSGSGASITKTEEETKTEKPKEEGKPIEEEKETVSASFGDTKGHWASDAIEFVHSEGIMQGTDEGTFAPDENMTRAMLVTVLFRMEKAEASGSENQFADVPQGQWYTDAINWAVKNGIVSGVSENQFAPNSNITREQMAVILYRYAQLKEVDTAVGENTNILSYEDFDETSEYAISAMQWTCGSGLIKGDSQSTLSPQSTATRAQVASILMRYSEMNAQ